MKVILDVKSPVKGVHYFYAAEGRKYVFQLIEIEEQNKQEISSQKTREEFPEFGSMLWLNGFSEKEIAQSKKSVFSKME